MAVGNLLALLDDITSMLDDVALMTKVAAKKTIGVLGDDLALNAQQVSGSSPNRELPVIVSVARGSLVNKAILIPLALAISAVAPWLITPLLMVGGAYLSYEGAEKVVEFIHKKRTPGRAEGASKPEKLNPLVPKPILLRVGVSTQGTLLPDSQAPGQSAPHASSAKGASNQDSSGLGSSGLGFLGLGPSGLPLSTPVYKKELAAEEKKKIRGAVRTDFILSTEIIVIALGSLPQQMPFIERAITLCIVGLCITIGVYGVVALIVKMDDFGLFLMRKAKGPGMLRTAGTALVGVMPYLMRFLTIAGTVAMFMVGGGILAHGIPWLEVTITSLSGLFLPSVKALLLHIGVGLVIGLAILAIVTGIRSLTAKVHIRRAAR